MFEVVECDFFTPTSYYDLEKDQCSVEVFFEDAAQEGEIKRALSDAASLLGVTPQYKLTRIRKSDWAHSWKRFFHVERISERIVIRPVWESYNAAPHECVISIDPGMSFGTGKHATTKACLMLLDDLARELPGASFLDMGCGSGILSIGAVMLGFKSVRGFDIDADSVRVACENAELNGLSIPFYAADLKKAHAPARVVAANILAPVLIEFRGSIAASVESHAEARLILSGILDSQYAEVRRSFESVGFVEMRNLLVEEWRSGVFARG